MGVPGTAYILTCLDKVWHDGWDGNGGEETLR